MGTLPESSSRRTAGAGAETGGGDGDPAADAAWQAISAGLSESWLEDIRGLRTERDDVETSLNIWSVALTAELRNPAHRRTASLMLARLVDLPEEGHGGDPPLV